MKYYIVATIIAVANTQLSVLRELQSEVLAENIAFNITYTIDN